jgi:hypothetical protein
MDNSDNPDNLRLSPENIELLSEIGLLLRDDLGIVVSMLLAYGVYFVICGLALYSILCVPHPLPSPHLSKDSSHRNSSVFPSQRPPPKIPPNLASLLRTLHHIHRHISLCRRPDVYRLFAPTEGADRPFQRFFGGSHGRVS